jgi:hypothetical protein
MLTVLLVTILPWAPYPSITVSPSKLRAALRECTTMREDLDSGRRKPSIEEGGGYTG